ncbi:hypothetical protein DV737_g754, partial [Chaetothyriales sp. CBS 132003]
MPVRPATRRDIPIMAQVMAASFGPDPLFQVFFPLQKKYWSDFEGAIRDNMWLAWYDYTKVLMVSYSDSDDDDDDDSVPRPSLPSSECKAAAVDQDTALLRPPPSKRERITGVAEWERTGRGWQWIHGAWGAWDPRLLVRPVLAFFYRLRRRVVGNRAAAISAFSLRENTTGPPPLTLWNFEEQVGPYISQFFSAPHRQTRWSLNNLAVHPNEQGKGYGRELVAGGFERLTKNDAEGELPVSVIAADGKETFYAKMGFTELVGWASKTVGEDGSDNPMRRNGVPGGAVLWTR